MNPMRGASEQGTMGNGQSLCPNAINDKKIRVMVAPPGLEQGIFRARKFIQPSLLSEMGNAEGGDKGDRNSDAHQPFPCCSVFT